MSTQQFPNCDTRITEVGEIFVSVMGQALCRVIFTDATLSITLLPKVELI